MTKKKSPAKGPQPKPKESRPGACAALRHDRDLVLTLAAEKMKKGWTAGQLHDVTPEGNVYCAIGAIRSVKGFKKAAKQAAVFALRDYLGVAEGMRPDNESFAHDGFKGALDVEYFNDKQLKAAPVLKAFRQARKQRLRTKPVNDN